MEVELNPGRIANTGVNQPVARQEPTPQPAENTMSFERIQALETNLQAATQIRPDAVARASSLVSDANYPPDELLDNIAGVLASRIQSQPD